MGVNSIKVWVYTWDDGKGIFGLTLIRKSVDILGNLKKGRWIYWRNLNKGGLDKVDIQIREGIIMKIGFREVRLGRVGWEGY